MHEVGKSEKRFVWICEVGKREGEFEWICEVGKRGEKLVWVCEVGKNEAKNRCGAILENIPRRNKGQTGGKNRYRDVLEETLGRDEEQSERKLNSEEKKRKQVDEMLTSSRRLLKPNGVAMSMRQTLWLQY